MDLYVANPTGHRQEFHFRLPEDQLRARVVTSGHQIKMTGLTAEDVDVILKQNRAFGWTDAREVTRARPFVGLVYSVDKPVTANNIRYTIEHNTGVLDARGLEVRKLAAVATNKVVQDHVHDATGSDVAKTEVVIQEEENVGKPNDLSSINEVIEVDRDAPSDGGKPRRRSGKR